MTKIGLLSDSHGRAEITARAITCLLNAGAELILHLGDIETEAVLEELVGHPVRLVFGNCDDARRLGAYAEHLGLNVDHPVGSLLIDDRTITYTHGHLNSAMAAALSEQSTYLLHGHTHEPRDERVGETRVINPGALFRAARYTVALLEPSTDRLEWFELAPTDVNSS